jgi:hypothetical protein
MAHLACAESGNFGAAMVRSGAEDAGGGGGQGERLEPGGARNGIGFRLAAAPHATARARLHAGYSARAIARSAARYRALHRAGLFSLPSAAARARSPPYHCSCGPAFN